MAAAGGAQRHGHHQPADPRVHRGAADHADPSAGHHAEGRPRRRPTPPAARAARLRTRRSRLPDPLPLPAGDQVRDPKEGGDFIASPDLPAQPVWGFNGISGADLLRTHGQDAWSALQRPATELRRTAGSMNTSRPTCKRAHTPSESDGFPCDFFSPGQFYDHHTPRARRVRLDPRRPRGDVNEALSTLGTTTIVDFTAQNVYKGSDRSPCRTPARQSAARSMGSAAGRPGVEQPSRRCCTTCR
jgi:hypothetical protein